MKLLNMMKQTKLLVVLAIGLFIGNSLKAQLIVPNNTYSFFLDPYYQTQEHEHTAVRPLNYFRYQHALDSFVNDSRIEGSFFTHNWLGRVMFNEDFLQYKKEDFDLRLNTFLDYSGGVDSGGISNSFKRGFNFNGHIGDYFAFQTHFSIVDQIIYPGYIIESINYRDANPVIGTLILGQGNGKRGASLDKSERNQFFTTSTFSYIPNKYFQFDGGFGKNFIGDGYRSLFLSDNANNYPFVRMVNSFGRVQFTTLVAQLRHLKQQYPDDTFMKKYLTARHLSWNVTDKLNIGFFDAVVYGDSLGTRGFEAEYLLPFILLRPLEFAIGSNAGNALLGGNISYKITPTTMIYGQFVLDEFRSRELFSGSGWFSNKFGGQFGVKSMNAFGVKNLFIQAEFNSVRPFTYSHKTALMAYETYNQSLAHPLGANFSEFNAITRYRVKRFYATAQIMVASQGLDTMGVNYGQDIFKSYWTRTQEYDNTIGQGVNTGILYGNLTVGFIINPKTGLVAEVGYTHRNFQPEAEAGLLQANTTNLITIGVKNLLLNYYYDF